MPEIVREKCGEVCKRTKNKARRTVPENAPTGTLSGMKNRVRFAFFGNE